MFIRMVAIALAFLGGFPFLMPGILRYFTGALEIRNVERFSLDSTGLSRLSGTGGLISSSTLLLLYSGRAERQKFTVQRGTSQGSVGIWLSRTRPMPGTILSAPFDAK